MPKTIEVQVSREIADDEDLGAYLMRVSSAVYENASVFGAKDGWDLSVLEVTPSSIVVRDYEIRRYLRADYSTDGEEVSFSNVKVVKRKWEEIGELGSVIRSDEDFFHRSLEVPDKNIWASLELLKLP